MSTVAFSAENPEEDFTTAAKRQKTSETVLVGQSGDSLLANSAIQEEKRESTGTTIILLDDLTRYLLHFGNRELLQRMTLTSKSMADEVWKYRENAYTHFSMFDLYILRRFLEQVPHPVAVRLTDVSAMELKILQDYSNKISQLSFEEANFDELVKNLPKVLQEKLKEMDQLNLPAGLRVVDDHLSKDLENFLSLTKSILICMKGREDHQNKLDFQWLAEFIDSHASARFNIKLAIGPVHILEYLNSIGDRYRKLSGLKIASHESDIHLLQRPEIAEILSELKLEKHTSMPVNLEVFKSLEKLFIQSLDFDEGLDKPFVIKGPPPLRGFELVLDGYPETLPEMVGFSNLQQLQIHYRWPRSDNGGKNKEVQSLKGHFAPLRTLNMLQSLSITFQNKERFYNSLSDLFKSLGEFVSELEFLVKVELFVIGSETAEHFKAMQDGQKSIEDCLEYLKENNPETSPLYDWYGHPKESPLTKWQSVDLALKLMQVQKKIKCKILVA